MNRIQSLELIIIIKIVILGNNYQEKLIMSKPEKFVPEQFRNFGIKSFCTRDVTCRFTKRTRV